jgi:probable HAF family extracellular repeat protein
MESLALLDGASRSRGFGVNDGGVVAGESNLATDRVGTLWRPGDAPTAIGTLSGFGSSVAFGVSNSGVAVGWSDSSDGTRAYRWTQGGGMESLGTLPGGDQSRAYAINSANQVAGWGRSPDSDRGFIADPGLESIGALSMDPASWTRAFGISNNGWLTGDASDPATGNVAFVWSSSMGLMSLGRLVGAARSFGADVNSAGVAVGWNDGLPEGEAAFLWTAADGMLDINALLVDAASGWLVQRARSINDLGYIVANAVNESGELRAVLLTPVTLAVPEPGSLVVLIAGLLALALVQRRPARES